ncbi:hypothetical protein E2C01_078827 [Portunus trituberculatus]|uniref:Uncharacterized protein n=1 Tax=Portunus trituberculatus TaxID=210409 RepID=A0A5B7IHV2_PORTR|nr:hypothetical protein [Portunus trituberculatus]
MSLSHPTNSRHYTKLLTRVSHGVAWVATSPRLASSPRRAETPMPAVSHPRLSPRSHPLLAPSHC